jgi:hypothetical protein
MSTQRREDAAQESRNQKLQKSDETADTRRTERKREGKKEVTTDFTGGHGGRRERKILPESFSDIHRRDANPRGKEELSGDQRKKDL